MINVSVGIIAFNEEKNIRNILNALLNQKLNKFEINEIIVVSSQCSDKTNEIVYEFSKKTNKIKLLCEEKRNGKFSAVNIFLKEASSKIIVLASADIIPDKNCIERICFPLLNDKIGIVGSRPIPKNNKNTFCGYWVNLEWELHHQIALKKPKFGELIAFRKNIETLPKTAVDEEEIAQQILSKGLKGVYEPKAIIYNYGPENITDIIKQRRRIFCGHIELKKRTQYSASTIKLKNILNGLLKIKHKHIIWSLLAIILEGFSRIIGLIDLYILKKKHSIWEISSSTKTSISRKNYSDITIIIPTLNEEKNIGDLIEEITATYYDIKIIVSDDSSKDKTQDIVKKRNEKNKNICLIERTGKIKGLTASVIDAVKSVNTENIIIMDGDFQHPPEKIKEFADALENYQLVIGKRNKVKEWRIDRKIMSFIATIIGKTRLIFKKTKCNDIMSGFFGIKTTIFKDSITNPNNSYELEGYKVLFDFLRNNNKKIDITEVNYDFGMRRNGLSKIGIKQIKSYLKSILR